LDGGLFPRQSKPSRYRTNTKINSAYHPSVVGKSSTGLFGWGWSGTRLLVSGGR